MLLPIQIAILMGVVVSQLTGYPCARSFRHGAFFCRVEKRDEVATKSSKRNGFGQSSSSTRVSILAGTEFQIQQGDDFCCMATDRAGKSLSWWL